jgi:hypothetical protein
VVGGAVKRPPASPCQLWTSFRRGITIIIAGLVLYLVALLVLLLILAAEAGGMERLMAAGETPAVARVSRPALVAAAVLVVAGLIVLVGQCVCCVVPRETEAKGLAQSSFVCLLAAVALALAGILLSLKGTPDHARGSQQEAGPPRPGPAALISLCSLLGFTLAAVASHGLFAAALGKTAKYLGSSAAEKNAAGYLLVFLLGEGGLLVATLVVPAGQQGASTLGRTLIWGTIITAFLFPIWLMILLGQVRGSVNQLLTRL